MEKYVEVTDLEKLHWILGIKITYDHESHSISLLQFSYIDAILHCYGFEDFKPVSMPMDTNIHLSSFPAPAST